jgi:hypothetical protein
LGAILAELLVDNQLKPAEDKRERMVQCRVVQPYQGGGSGE